MSEFSYRRVGMIGSGRVARAMGRALAPHSACPLLCWGRDRERTRHAADGVEGHVATHEADLVRSCDLIILAIADDAIAPVALSLAKTPLPSPPPLIVHVSGASGVAPLEPLRAAGALTAAIHPAMTFTGDPAAEVARMQGAAFAITGSSSVAMAQAQALVALLGGVSEVVEEEQRALDHAALSHAANHMVTLIAGAGQALSAAGIGDPAGLLAPLVRATLDNTLAMGFDALSGPLLRGDARTIRQHLLAFDRDCPRLLPAYRAMAKATLEELDRHGERPSSPAMRALLD